MSSRIKGFTLIELLIVIVIISILAGVLVALINPTVQQNRARDANVQATMNKAALATEAFNSAYGRYPTGAEFLAAVNATLAGGTTCATTTDHCSFTVVGSALPLTCTGSGQANNWWGTTDPGSTSQCAFRYERRDIDLDPNGIPEEFFIWARSWGISNGHFQYSSIDSAITQCTNAIVDLATDLPC